MNNSINQFYKFIITGGIAATINITSRIFLSKFISFGLSVFISYLIGLTAAFILARKFVFENSKNSLIRAMLGFLTVNLFAILQTWVLSVISRNYLLVFIPMGANRDLISHIIGVSIPAISSYYGHKHISFRK